MTIQQNERNDQNTKEPIKLEVTTAKFDGLIKSKLVTTISLGKIVWDLFKPVFPEYEGCVIQPDQYGQLQIVVYFKDKGKIVDSNAIKAVTPVGTNQQNNSAFNRIATINQRLSSKKLELTNDAKDILGEFYWTKGNNKVNWNNFVTEVTSQDYNGYSIHLKVAGMDLGRIIRKIYGSKVNGARVDYAISIIKPLGIDNTGSLQNFLISIQQLNTKECEDLAKNIGVVPVNGSIPMLRN